MVGDVRNGANMLGTDDADILKENSVEKDACIIWRGKGLSGLRSGADSSSDEDVDDMFVPCQRKSIRRAFEKTVQRMF